MKIQWFPGHMHKAQKEIREVLSGIDVVIEVLDARIPYSSQNPLLDSILKLQPRIRLLNKSDLADAEVTADWLKHLAENKAMRVLTTSISAIDDCRDIPSLCRDLVPGRGGERPVHALIVGIPNVGKSTIINRLAGRSIAKTGNEPAITKAQQRIDIGNGVVLRDTPGVLWPNLENRDSGYRLAVTGAIRDTAIDSADVASWAAEFLQLRYAERIRNRYGYETPATASAEVPDALPLLEYIGRLRGCLGGGGLVDFDRVARIMLTDIRAGELGPLSFETPVMMAAEQRAVNAERLQRQAQQEQRENRKSRSKSHRESQRRHEHRKN